MAEETCYCGHPLSKHYDEHWGDHFPCSIEECECWDYCESFIPLKEGEKNQDAEKQSNQA